MLSDSLSSLFKFQVLVCFGTEKNRDFDFILQKTLSFFDIFFKYMLCWVLSMALVLPKYDSLSLKFYVKTLF